MARMRQKRGMAMRMDFERDFEGRLSMSLRYNVRL
jgi:hypothetical protein